MKSAAARISSATRECLRRCHAAPDPLDALRTFLDELRADPAWTPEELHVFEMDALRVLIKISEQPRKAVAKMMPPPVR